LGLFGSLVELGEWRGGVGRGGERRDGQAAWTLRRGEGGRVVRRRVRRREGGVRARIFSGGGGVGGGGC